jgi:uncharacterized protein (TIGR02600 family)
MKSPTPIDLYRPRGAALVIVLAFLLIVTAMVVAFLSSISTETSSSRTQANVDRVQQLADAVPQIAIARIRDATSGHVNPADPSSAMVSWASQPGMIRTYQSNGSPGPYYRLYSAASESTPGLSFNLAAEAPPANWDVQKGVFVDLNSPVVRTASGTKIAQFPIVDPRAKAGTLAASVEGFDYSTSAVNGIVAPGGDPNDQRLPMPVRWMYLLADGTFAIPQDGTTNGIVSFVSGAPSASNPIVGRMAFWVDDETSKVNINTASEGTFYDLPRYTGAPDYVLSMFPPLINEFQRYPGHPSTTALSTVLKPWLPSINDVPITYDYNYIPPGVNGATIRIASAAADEIQARLERYLRLTPRYRFGGTKGATILTAVNPSNNTVAPLTPKTERLYNSVDELLYAPNRGASDPAIDNSVLEKTRFFLTASNRAPEVNLFGKPRLSIWPLSSENDATHRTVQDRLLARCATIGQPYFFQRLDPDSSTADYTNIARNQELYAYLKDLTSSPNPGFGGSFSGKYGIGERDQILTEIFDYIRACNLNDPNLPTNGTYTDSYKLGGTYYNPYNSPYRSPGFVVPIKINGTKGAGRFPVIDQAFLVFYTPDLPTIPSGGTVTDTETKIRGALYFNFMHPMQGFMVAFTNLKLEVSAGTTFACSPVSNSDPAKSASLVNGQPVEAFNFFKDGPTVTQWANANERGNGQANSRNFGGNHSYSAMADHEINEMDPRKRFTLVSAGIPVIKGDPTLARWNLSGGTFNVKVLSADGDEIQTYEFEFPDAANLPIPTPVAYGVYTSGTLSHYNRVAPDIDLSYGRAQTGGLSPLINDRDVKPGDNTKTIVGGDVVRSLQLTNKAVNGDYVGGDFRRLAYTKAVPKAWFAKHKNYDNGARMAHSLRDGNGNALPGSLLSGNLVPSINWAVNYGSNVWNNEPSYFPYVRSEINGVYASDTGATSDPPGDWNNGFGATPDGAYLNRADEGVIFSSGGGGAPYFDWDGAPQDKNLTSPNKQLPSAGMFGSLPTGTTLGFSWRTLLFRPDHTAKHAGATSPADHLLLDLFWMPVVEPYAISEPFSTAGKINMNYQIMPFTYITRETGVRAVLAAERMLAIPGESGTKTYTKSTWNKPSNPDLRFKINPAETLKGFAKRFSDGDLFRSASEICSLDLVPDDPTDPNANFSSMKTYWEKHMLTGDNVRERPYTTIYPRLTTKSNTFTVHFIVQSLKKVPSTPANQWIEGKDVVTGEYRGSAMIERYIDPLDPSLPDFATATTENVERYYRWRVTNAKKFTP